MSTTVSYQDNTSQIVGTESLATNDKQKQSDAPIIIYTILICIILLLLLFYIVCFVSVRIRKRRRDFALKERSSARLLNATLEAEKAKQLAPNLPHLKVESEVPAKIEMKNVGPKDSSAETISAATKTALVSVSSALDDLEAKPSIEIVQPDAKTSEQKINLKSKTVDGGSEAPQEKVTLAKKLAHDQEGKEQVLPDGTSSKRPIKYIRPGLEKSVTVKPTKKSTQDQQMNKSVSKQVAHDGSSETCPIKDIDNSLKKPATEVQHWQVDPSAPPSPLESGKLFTIIVHFVTLFDLMRLEQVNRTIQCHVIAAYKASKTVKHCCKVLHQNAKLCAIDKLKTHFPNVESLSIGSRFANIDFDGWNTPKNLHSLHVHGNLASIVIFGKFFGAVSETLQELDLLFGFENAYDATILEAVLGELKSLNSLKLNLFMYPSCLPNKKLPNLKIFDISYYNSSCHCTISSFLSFNDQLEVLKIGSLKLDVNIAEQLLRLQNLKLLRLANMDIDQEDGHHVACCKNLIELELSYCRFRNYSILAEILSSGGKNMKRLTLHIVQLNDTSVVPDICSLPSSLNYFSLWTDQSLHIRNFRCSNPVQILKFHTSGIVEANFSFAINDIKTFSGNATNTGFLKMFLDWLNWLLRKKQTEEKYDSLTKLALSYDGHQLTNWHIKTIVDYFPKLTHFELGNVGKIGNDTMGYIGQNLINLQVVRLKFHDWKSQDPSSLAALFHAPCLRLLAVNEQLVDGIKNDSTVKNKIQNRNVFLVKW